MYKRQRQTLLNVSSDFSTAGPLIADAAFYIFEKSPRGKSCLLYTSDAADDLLCVDLGGRRIIKKKKTDTYIYTLINIHKHKSNITLTPQHHALSPAHTHTYSTH